MVKEKSLKRHKALILAVLLLLVILITFAQAPESNISISDNSLLITKKIFNITIGEKAYNLTNANNIENNTKYLFELKKEKGKTSKNFIILPNTTSIKTASQLLNEIPNCEGVSYWNTTLKRWVGWISLRGGRGTDFATSPNQIIEIAVTDNTNWITS